MSKRTFSISEIVVEETKEMAKYFHVDMKTIISFALYHGIEHLKNGYRPFRYKNKSIKKKIEIFMPEETWIEFCRLLDRIKDELKEDKEQDCTKEDKDQDYKKEHIPDGEIVELFIKIELKRLMNIKKDYEDSLDISGKQYSSDAVHPMSVKYDIPEFIYENLQQRFKMMDISESQIGKYLLLKGICAEYEQDFDIIESDADLIEAMDAMRLQKVQAFALIKYLLQSNRIRWVK